jgi:integrative and conjugative element protein (TIGR02256 family)
MSIIWHCPDFSQVVTLSDEVIQYVSGYRQHSASATEAGGQLFGTVAGKDVRVSVATGPYPGDDRSRYGYRSNPAAAAAAINLQESKGLGYLGEWHTHAECHPKPSGADMSTMLALVQKSTLGAGAAMLLIVGTAPALGFYLGTFEKGRFRRWEPEGSSRPRCRLSRWIVGLRT